MTHVDAITIAEPDNNQLIEGCLRAMDMWKEAKTYNHMKMELDHVVDFAYNMRADPDHFLRVAVLGDKVIGFIAGSLARYGFYPGAYAHDRMLYVTPTARGSVAARMLIRSFEEWAKQHDADYVLMGVTTGIHTERTEKFYNKLGYATVGRLTMKEL